MAAIDGDAVAIPRGQGVTPLDDWPEIDEEAQLILRACKGDASAFARLMQLHERQVLGTAARILRNLEDAKDAAQEVFLKLYRNLAQIRTDVTLRPWLYRVTVNACRDLLRKSRFSPSAPLTETLAASDRSDEGLAADERRRILTAALQMLPFKERAALVLRDIEGLSTEETARVLGSSKVTVRGQVASARIKIKRYVDHALRRKP